MSIINNYYLQCLISVQLRKGSSVGIMLWRRVFLRAAKGKNPLPFPEGFRKVDGGRIDTGTNRTCPRAKEIVEFEYDPNLVGVKQSALFPPQDKVSSFHPNKYEAARASMAAVNVNVLGPLAMELVGFRKNLPSFFESGTDVVRAVKDARPSFVISAIRKGTPLLLVWRCDYNGLLAITTTNRPLHPKDDNHGINVELSYLNARAGTSTYNVRIFSLKTKNFKASGSTAHWLNWGDNGYGGMLHYDIPGDKWGCGGVEVYEEVGVVPEQVRAKFKETFPLSNPHVNEEELEIICALAKKTKFPSEVVLASDGGKDVGQQLAKHCTTNLAGTAAQLLATTGLGTSGVRRIRVVGTDLRPNELAHFLKSNPVPATVVWEFEGTDGNVDDIVTLFELKPHNMQVVYLINCTDLKGADLLRIIDAGAPHLKALIQTTDVKNVSASMLSVMMTVGRQYPNFHVYSVDEAFSPPQEEEQQRDGSDDDGMKLPDIIDVDPAVAAPVQGVKTAPSHVSFYVPSAGVPRKVRCCHQRASDASRLIRGMLQDGGEGDGGEEPCFPIDTSFPVTKEAIQLMVLFMERVATKADLQAAADIVDAKTASVYLPPHYLRFLDVVATTNPYRTDHMWPLLSQLLELAVYFNIDSLKVFVRSAFVYDMAIDH